MNEVEEAAKAAEGTAAAETEEQIRARLEAQLTAEFEADIDRRVGQAYRTFQRKQEREKEAELLRIQQAKQAEVEERAAAVAEKEHELNVKGCRLDLIDIIAERDLPSDFRILIACEDLADMDERERYRMLRERVASTSVEFNRLVKQAVEEQRKLFTGGGRIV